MEKKIYIKKLLLIILFFTTTIIILSNSNLSYGASLSVRNDREPRIVCKKTDKNYLYITLHDSSGIILDSAEATLAGKKCKYVLIEVNDGIYTLKGKRIKDIIRKGGSYSGKKYDYGIKIKNSDLSSKEFKDLYIYSYDYGHACFIKETLKVKKYDGANKKGEYYCVNRAPRATVHSINNKVKVDAVDYTGIKSIKIVSKKSNEVVYSYVAGKANDSTKNQKGINKDGNFYPYKVVEDIDMKLIEKAQKDKPGRYRFRIFVEDASGIKSEKTMTSTVSQTNTNTNTNRNTDSSDNTNANTGDALNKKAGFFEEKYNGMKYYLSVPDNPTEGLPLIIFLHGDGEQNKFKKLGRLPIVSYVKSKKAYKAGKFIFIAPVRTTSYWASGSDYKKVMKLIDKVTDEYKVDKNRIILTGMSSGGNGTWNIAWKNPNKFAGILVMSGKTAGAEHHAKRLANLPVYGICGDAHGEEKERNRQMKKMINKINKYSNKTVARLETIHGATHGSIQKYYKRQSVFQWMLSQRKN